MIQKPNFYTKKHFYSYPPHYKNPAYSVFVGESCSYQICFDNTNSTKLLVQSSILYKLLKVADLGAGNGSAVSLQMLAYNLSLCTTFQNRYHYIAILAGVVNFLPHPNPPLGKGRE